MTTPAPITDHVAQGLSKLTSPFKNKPRFAAWFASHLIGWQDLEDHMQVFLASWDVDTCDLPRLTILGKFVGQSPVGTLETFRRLVKARIMVNRSDTSGPTLIKIARVLLGGDVWYTDGGCAISIEARSPLPLDVDGAVLASFLRLAKMGGVQLTLVAQNETVGFLFGDDNAANVTTVHGMSDDTGTTGGKLPGDF